MALLTDVSVSKALFTSTHSKGSKKGQNGANILGFPNLGDYAQNNGLGGKDGVELILARTPSFHIYHSLS